MEKIWRPDVPGTCINLVQFYYGLQIPNIITDVWIVVSPIRELMRMELTRKIKTGAIAMFLLGSVTVAFDIVRLVVLLDLGHTGPDVTLLKNSVEADSYSSEQIISRMQPYGPPSNPPSRL
ncbi:hypothetical protein LTR17_002562 [Elasticomyces elasticus]|nr:hypothetical protein LTR17_002562 [Elasticomyces elasticus]